MAHSLVCARERMHDSVLATLFLATASLCLVAVAVGVATPVSAQAIEEEYYGPDHGTPLGNPPDADVDPSYQDDTGPAQVDRDRYSDYDDRGSYKDDYVQRDRNYRSRRPVKRYKSTACVRPRDIRRGLRGDGWYGFADFEVSHDEICLTARRKSNGVRYELVLDRCTGAIVRAQSTRRTYRTFGRYHPDDYGYRY